MAMKNGSAWCLGVLLCGAIMTIWISGAWINPSLFEAGVFLLACCWAVRMIWSPYAVRGSWVLGCLGFAAVWPLVQLALGVTVSRWETFQAALLWSGDFAAAFLAMQIFSGDGGAKRREWFVRLLGYFAFGIVLLALFDSFTGEKRIFWIDQGGAGSPWGPFVNRDTLAAFGELALPLILYPAFRGGERTGLMEAGMAAAVYAAVIAGASRTGAAVMTAEVAVLLWAGRKRHGMGGGATRLVAAFGVMAAIFVGTVGAGKLAARFEQKNPYKDRRELLLSSIEMARERPWFGFGLGNFENAYPKYARFDSDKTMNHAHNDWAEWAATGGWPFFAAMGLVVVWAAGRAYRSVWGIGILAVFVHCLTDFPFQISAMQFWVFTLMGVLATEKTTYRSE